MDGFRKGFDDTDISRQNAIASLLENWGMLEIVERELYQDPLEQKIFVLSYKDKQDGYEVNHKYRMGIRK
jgi:hypothetical protein